MEMEELETVIDNIFAAQGRTVSEKIAKVWAREIGTKGFFDQAIKEAEKELQKFGFLRCNQCYLVNPKFIISVKGKELQVGNEKLLISRPKYKSFMMELTNWYAGQGNK